MGKQPPKAALRRRRPSGPALRRRRPSGPALRRRRPSFLVLFPLLHCMGSKWPVEFHRDAPYVYSCMLALDEVISLPLQKDKYHITNSGLMVAARKNHSTAFNNFPAALSAQPGAGIFFSISLVSLSGCLKNGSPRAKGDAVKSLCQLARSCAIVIHSLSATGRPTRLRFYLRQQETPCNPIAACDARAY